MVQLWVNLPAKDKSAKPGYQTLLDRRHSDGAIAERRRLTARDRGQFGTTQGPARTYTPINIWDVRLRRDKGATFEIPEGHTLSVLILSGHGRGQRAGSRA